MVPIGYQPIYWWTNIEDDLTIIVYDKKHHTTSRAGANENDYDTRQGDYDGY